MKPEWVLKHKKPGCTIKEINGKYYLYYATSRYDPNKSYPVSIQTYIGRITPEGVVSERVSIDISVVRQIKWRKKLQIKSGIKM